MYGIIWLCWYFKETSHRRFRLLISLKIQISCNGAGRVQVFPFFLVAKINIGLWCLMLLSTIFQLCHGVQFHWWKNLQNTTDLSQDKFYHIMLYWVHPTVSEIRTHNFSGDRHWFHRWLLIQLPYDNDHDCPPSPQNNKYIKPVRI